MPSSFFVALEAALALVWHSWDGDAREAAALAGCVPLKANLLDKGPKDWQDEVMRCVIVPMFFFQKQI